MERKDLIKEIIAKVNYLPDEKIKEVYDFTEFLLSKIEERLISEGIKRLASKSESFDFLKDDEDLYTVNDLKEKYK